MIEFVIRPDLLAAEALVVVENVPIIKVGYEYQLSSGPYTATFGDIVDFVESQDDPVIKAPRFWLGHPDASGRFPRPEDSAEPAFGVYANVRLNENGTMAVGDIAGVPAWVADIIATAYPNRSMEGITGYETEHTRKKYGLVIKDIALLGVVWPGIHCLADLKIAFTAEGPEGIEVGDTTSKETPVTDEAKAALVAAAKIVAQVNVEDVHRAAWDMYEEDSRFCWICGIFIDPNQVIVEAMDGQLWRVDFTLNGEEVTFGEPAAVKIEYVPDEKAEAVSVEASTAARVYAACNAVADGRTPVAVYASRDTSRRTTNKEASVSFIDAARKKLRLASDVSEDDVLDAIPEPADEPATDPAAPPETDPADEPAPEGDPAPATDPAPVQPEAASGNTMTVDRTAFAETQRQAEQGAQFAANARVERDDNALTAGIKDGRIAAAQRDEYAKRLASDRDNGSEGTYALLTATAEDGGLAPDTIPVTMRGIGEQTAAATSGGDLNALFPQLNKKEGE